MTEKNNHILENLTGISKDDYGENYSDHILEIYKLYVDMANCISERRQKANSYFLTINTAIMAIVGCINLLVNESAVFFLFALVAIAGMVLSFFWYRLVLSYKQLNSGKFKVIHVIESKLPIRPYEAEWTALGCGKLPCLYNPFTHIEIKIPWVFFSLHAIILIISLYLIFRCQCV